MENFFNQNAPRVARSAIIFLTILSLFFVVKGAIALKEYKFIGSGTTATNTIQIQGDGEVFAVPDIAEISFSVSQDSKTMVEAQKIVTEKINKALAYLKTQNILDKDIKTQNYNASPKHEWQTVACAFNQPCPGGKDVIVGYTVNQTILVKVRKSDEAGKIITGLTQAGITDLSGPNFTIDNDEALKAEARKKAIADAKVKAEALAKDLGVSLVRIVNFSENSGGNYPPMYAKTMMTDAVGGGPEMASLPKGENKYTSQVYITYEIR